MAGRRGASATGCSRAQSTGGIDPRTMRPRPVRHASRVLQGADACGIPSRRKSRRIPTRALHATETTGLLRDGLDIGQGALQQKNIWQHSPIRGNPSIGPESRKDVDAPCTATQKRGQGGKTPRRPGAGRGGAPWDGRENVLCWATGIPLGRRTVPLEGGVVTRSIPSPRLRNTARQATSI